MVTISRTEVEYEDLEVHRRELTGYCYRMLGAGYEAEDAVQEVLVRAWKAADRFEGRSSLRSWLYRIATNVCLDMRQSPQRRARPMELGPPSAPREEFLGPWMDESRWISPIPDDRIAADGDPAEVAETRDSIRLAFVAALQHLPARQRAVLILCEVLKWQATEAAELLETSVAAVNSALQRARATMGDLAGPERLDEVPDPALLDDYVDAFQRYDIDRLVTLLQHDAVMSMPPFPMWLRGATDIGKFMLEPGPSACADSVLVPVSANGCPAFGQYKPDPAGGRVPWGLQVLEVSGGRISGFHCFLDSARIFPAFGLPAHLD